MQCRPCCPGESKIVEIFGFIYTSSFFECLIGLMETRSHKKVLTITSPKKDNLVPKWVPAAKLALIVHCRQNSCLSENPCCRKPECFYFGSFSLDDPHCCCYNNNTSMFNSLQCSDNACDSHTEICVCVSLRV